MSDDMTHFRSILSRFDTAMLVTHTTSGRPRARPMTVAGAEERGDLWFAAAIDSDKIDELSLDKRVCATFQNARQYLSVSGTAEVVSDKTEIEQRWREAWRPWFPDGKKDPRLVLIRLKADEAEYWDLKGTKGLRYLFDAAQAVARRQVAPDKRRAPYHARMSL